MELMPNVLTVSTRRSETRPSLAIANAAYEYSLPGASPVSLAALCVTATRTPAFGLSGAVGPAARRTTTESWDEAHVTLTEVSSRSPTENRSRA